MNTQSSDSPSKTPALILVVDDEERNRRLLKDVLESQGYRVSLAENGKMAIEEASKNPPDVILLDVMMPLMDGFEACSILKSDPLTESIPVLIITALTEREDRLKGIGAGAMDFITKPIDIEEVLLRVRNAAYSKQLYDNLELKNQLLEAEKEKTEKLLLNILPGPVAERLKEGEKIIADRFDEATILFADIVGFTNYSSDISPGELVDSLNGIWSIFDRMTDRYNVEKIKTVGDGYMIAGGIPTRRNDHAEAVARTALEMQREIEKFRTDAGKSFDLRIGISSGPVVAGVIGEKKFIYDLWGDTVNTAHRMQSYCENGHVQTTRETYMLLKDKFELKERGEMEIKGKGIMKTYYLTGEKT